MSRSKSTICLSLLLIAVVALPPASALDLKSPSNKAVLSTTAPELSWEAADMAFLYEVSVWESGSSKLVYHGFPGETSLKVKADALEMGKAYVWAVKAKSTVTGPAIDESPRWSFSCGEAVDDDDRSGGEFKKTGATLVIPVEFKSHKFSGDPVAVVTRKMEEMEDYYRSISYNAPGTMGEVAFDVAPGVFLNVDRDRYSADKKDSGGNWMRDCGDFGKSWAGAHQMKKAVLSHVFKNNVPVKEYRHIIYIVPGSGGNSWGSEQFWPASTTGNPSGIRYSERKGVVSGSYATGIVMAIGVSTGTYNHEFGHQLGLPDLYPYTTIPDRNLGYNALMASGNQVGDLGVCMFSLSRTRSYSDKAKKKDWLGGKFETISSNKVFWVDSRTSEGGTLSVAIPDKSTRDGDDHIIIEVFDRKGADEDFVGYFKGPKGNSSKATAAVFLAYVDDLDVHKIKKAHCLPKSSNRKQNFFLTGGEYKKDKFSIKVLELRDLKDRWAAKIAVSFDGLEPIDDADDPVPGKVDKPDKEKKGFFGWIKDFFGKIAGWFKRDKQPESEGTSSTGFMLGMFEEVSKQAK